MVNIYDLDEEQLREYASSQSEEAGRNYALEEAIDKLKYIQKAYKRQQKEFDVLIELLQNKCFDEVYDKCAEFGIKLDRLSTRVKTFPFEIGEKSSNAKVRLGNAALNGRELIFKRNSEYLEVILPELLPHKQQYNAETGKMHFYYDIDSWKANYYNQFAKEFETGKYGMFYEKVSICYVMHIAENMKNGVADTDNYDTKVMTDIITTYLLYDDNFLCCNYMVDIVIDDNCHDVDDCFTDIIICPADRREEILKRMGL